MFTQKSLFNLLTNSPTKNNEKTFWDEHYLIPNTPPEWFPLRNRKIWWCAHYSLKAVIEWKEKKKRPIEDYSSDWWSRKTYLMTPWWIIKVLKKYKLEYTVIKAKTLTKDERLFLLKYNLKQGPIILLVANWQTKKKRFSRRRALVHRHYITLRWYDEKSKSFYVYDSNTKGKSN